MFKLREHARNQSVYRMIPGASTGDLIHRSIPAKLFWTAYYRNVHLEYGLQTGVRIALFIQKSE